MDIIFNFVLRHFGIIELIVFWYPIIMGMLWVIGGIIYYWRLERKDPLPLTSTPLVSILVPAYNEGDNIINTVERLNDLNYPNYEIIVINDGSKDNSPELVYALAEKYERVRFIDLKENSGKANALYLGYVASKGEYLVCVDGDSYLDKDCLRYMIPHFTNPNNGERVGAVTGNPRVRNRSSLLAKIQLCEYASIISLIKRTQRIWGKVMTVSGVVVAFRKQALMDCGLWDRDMITEDIGVTWKLERKYWDVRYEPRALCWMLVPETVKGLFKQRRRWAQGGQEVMLRHFGIFKSWRTRRMVPIYIEQVMSLLWVLLWLLLTVTEIFRLCYRAESYLPYFWKSQFLAVICMFQFAVAVILEKKYDKTITKGMLVAAWYPFIYWVISGLTALSALPSTILGRKKKLATWSSPDRGLGTADAQRRQQEVISGSSTERSAGDQTAVTFNAFTDNRGLFSPSEMINNSDKHAKKTNKKARKKEQQAEVIDGKQSPIKKIIEVIVTVFMWALVLLYLGYCVYGVVCIGHNWEMYEFFIYSRDMIFETGNLLKITGIIVLIEIVILIFWKEYNRIRFSKLNRRKFKPEVSMEQMTEFFKLPVEKIIEMRESKVILLEKNIIAKDHKAKPVYYKTK